MKIKFRIKQINTKSKVYSFLKMKQLTLK